MVGQPGLIDDPRFVDDLARGDHGEILSDIMMAWCEPGTKRRCVGNGRCQDTSGSNLFTQQTLDDEHVQALDFLKAVDYPTAAQSIPTADFPVSMSAPGPRFGNGHQCWGNTPIRFGRTRLRCGSD
ncbi:MAG: hypothetical protein Ct9H300mP13_4540 [Gammaproteobacteria bacterium]|nr:MAG: hypothetical protein Ct9H300mP13_4540 [Gammaproteobacteria bacterium]